MLSLGGGGTQHGENQPGSFLGHFKKIGDVEFGGGGGNST